MKEVPQYDGEPEDRDVSMEDIKDALLRQGIIPRWDLGEDLPMIFPQIPVNKYLEKTDKGEILSQKGRELGIDTLKTFAIHSTEIKDYLNVRGKQDEYKNSPEDLELQYMREKMLDIFVLHADKITQFVDYQIILEVLNNLPLTRGPVDSVKQNIPFLSEKYNRRQVKEMIEAGGEPQNEDSLPTGGQIAEYILFESHQDDMIDTSQGVDIRLRQGKINKI